MKISENGLDIIRVAEGCRLKAYRDGGGVPTIGYGITSAAGIIPVAMGMTITQEQAEEYLRKAVAKFDKAVSRAITVPLNQNQHDACVSLCYNIGETQFTKSSVAKFCNAGKFGEAADAFLLWNKDNGKVVAGLVARRKMERTLFLKAMPVGQGPTRPVADSPIPLPPDIGPPDDDPFHEPGWLERMWMWIRRYAR